MDKTDGALGVFGQNQQDIVRANHAHRLLYRCSFIRSLKENRRDGISGNALAQALQALCRPVAMDDEHASIASQEPANFREIVREDVRHVTGDADLAA